MLVMKLVKNPAPLTPPDDEAEVTKDAELVRDCRALHPEGDRDLADRAWPDVEQGEDSQPAWRRERLHRLGDLMGYVNVEKLGGVSVQWVTHRPDYS